MASTLFRPDMIGLELTGQTRFNYSEYQEVNLWNLIGDEVDEVRDVGHELGDLGRAQLHMFQSAFKRFLAQPVQSKLQKHPKGCPNHFGG